MKFFSKNLKNLLPKSVSDSFYLTPFKNYRTIKSNVEFISDKTSGSDNKFPVDTDNQLKFQKVWKEVIYNKQTKSWDEILNSLGINLEEINKQVAFDTNKRLDLINEINEAEKFEEKDKIISSKKINDYDDLFNVLSKLKDDEYKKYIFNYNPNYIKGDIFSDPISGRGSHAVPLYIVKKGENIDIFPALDERLETTAQLCDFTQRNLRKKPTFYLKQKLKILTSFQSSMKDKESNLINIIALSFL